MNEVDEAKALDMDTHGAMAELLVAKTLNRFWTNPFLNTANKNLPNVGNTIEVRHTKYPSGCLLVHDEDVDNFWHVLVVGTISNPKVVGGILGKDAKKEIWWKEKVAGRPCYFVPQDKLIPVPELIKLVD